MPSMTNYPNGFNFGVSLKEVPIQLAQPGQVFWVSNSTVLAPGQKGGSDSNDGTYNRPFATLDFAISQCVANRGDIIFVKPGHAETISTATALAFDVAGVAIIGLGSGTLRPTITFGAAAATIAVTAAGVTCRNILFIANFAAVTSAFTVSARSFHLEGNEFRDTSSILNFVACVTTSGAANAADGLAISGNKVFGLGTTAATTPFKIAASQARVVVADNYVVLAILNDTSALLALGASVLTFADIQGNRVYRPNTTTANGFLISGSATTCTGIVKDNIGCHATAIGALLFATSLALRYVNNLNIGDADASAFLLPAVGAN